MVNGGSMCKANAYGSEVSVQGELQMYVLQLLQAEIRDDVVVHIDEYIGIFFPRWR
jgi:hypothetical protein